MNIQKKYYPPRDINGYILKIGDLIWISDSDDYDTLALIYDLKLSVTEENYDTVKISWVAKILCREVGDGYYDFVWTNCYKNWVDISRCKKELSHRDQFMGSLK